MMTSQPALPRRRIEVIDALRGFALLGIIFMHCHVHFELYIHPQYDMAWLKWLDQTVRGTINFIVSGKSYGIFALLFGLSFFIQMENQAERGIDFRGRFAWRLVILYALGFINGLFYQGEIIAVYTIFGLLLIPLWKVPNSWLWVLFFFFFFQVPYLIQMGLMAFDVAPYAGRTISALIALGIGILQITYSHWWLKRYSYGPVEWLWRSLTWLSFKVPFRRPKIQA